MPNQKQAPKRYALEKEVEEWIESMKEGAKEERRRRKELERENKRLREKNLELERENRGSRNPLFWRFFNCCAADSQTNDDRAS